MWTKNPASAASVEVFSTKLRTLLGVDTSCGVDYARCATIAMNRDGAPIPKMIRFKMTYAAIHW